MPRRVTAMRRSIVRAVNERSDFTVTRKPSTAEAAEAQAQYDAQVSFLLARFLQSTSDDDLADVSQLLSAVTDVTRRGIRPTSQLLQECFALAWNDMEPSTFVEVGAAGPEFLSNTLVLQSDFGWGGLLVEPNPESVRALARRRSGRVEIAGVAAGSPGQVEFVVAGELSTAVDMLGADMHERTRGKAMADSGTIRVKRVPLDGLLAEHFPGETTLGFLSVDVEGAERDVLASVDWARWRFRAIAIEHNHRRPFEVDCDQEMSDRGYRRVLAGVSGWDGWYVPATERK